MGEQKNRTCIVTGGAGFIGSHLVQRLLEYNHKVIILDNFSTGRIENFELVAGNPHLKIVNADIAQYVQIEPYFKDCDWVFHLGALADIVPSIQSPMNYHHTNVDGTISVLEAARHNNVKRFVYAASSTCYGIPDNYPTPESAPIRPMYPYALTKNVGEQYVLHWNNLYGLPCISLRLFNVYGPRARTSGTYGAVFGVFLAQKNAGKPFTIVGNGSQTRDFTYVTDVVDSFITSAESDIKGEIFNVGSDGTYSINYLVSLLGGEKTYIPKRPGEPDCTHADITKIKTILGWSPKVSFEKGVAQMLDHIDQWKNAPVWDKDSISAATKDWFKYLGKGEQKINLTERSESNGTKPQN